MGTPLAEVFSPLVGDEIFVTDVPVFIFVGIVFRAVAQDEVVVPVGFEPFAVTILIQHIFRFVVDDVLVHGDGGRVEGRSHAAPFPYDVFHLGDAVDPLVELADHIQVLRDTGVGHGGGHQEEGSFIQRRHEFFAYAGESLVHGLPGPGLAEVPADLFRACRDEAEELVETLPGHDTENEDEDGEGQELPFVLQHPPQDRGVGVYDEHQGTEHHGDDHTYEDKVDEGRVQGSQRQPFDGQQPDDHDQRDGYVDPVDIFPFVLRPLPEQEVVDADKDQGDGQPGMIFHQEEYAAGDQQTVPDAVGFFPVKTDGESDVGKGRNENDADKERCQQGEGLGERQGPEQLAFGGLHRKYRQETDDSSGEGCDDGRCHLDGGGIDHFHQLFTPGSLVLRHIQMPDDILGEDDPHIRHHPDGDGDTRKSHDIGIHAELLHDNEGDQHAQGQQAGNKYGGPQVEHQDHHHDDTDQDLVGKGCLQGAEGLFDQTGTVVKRHNGHFRDGAVLQLLGGQAGGDLFDLLFHVPDHLHGVGAVTGHHHAAHRFGASFVEAAAACGRTEMNVRHLFQPHRHIVPYCHHALLQILQ